MDLEHFYPSADDLVGHEIKVLDFLRSDPYIKEQHSRFAQDAATYFGRNKNAQKGFEFFSYLDVSHDQKRNAKPNLRLIVAARIERKANAYTNVSYCLCICRTRKLSVLRKFHFDIAATHDPARRRQPHPRCHLQYGGKMIPEMEEMGVKTNQLETLYPSLSEPRIFSWPMSLALLVDMTLHEFPDSRSEKFRRAPDWRGIIRSHETALLRPFFEKCLEVIKYRDASRPTLSDAFYVN
jgi:hypothetical protein